MGDMPARKRDAVDHHVARWSEYWADNPRFAPQVEGAITRMQNILKRLRRADAAAFAGSDFTIEDFSTLHALMVRPYPTEATPAQLAEWAVHALTVQPAPTEATPAELAEVSGVSRAGMTSRLDRLVEAGLVTREVDPQDRRRVLIRPTPAGREAWDNAVHEGMAREQHLLHALSVRELDQLNTLLRKVILSLDDAEVVPPRGIRSSHV
jgi:DNA-binding MarR family transcriptional regulator